MACTPVEIINVRADKGEDTIHDQIVAGLSKPAGQKSLPTVLVYDERGLRLFDEISQKAPEYYLFPAEEGILKDHADEIAQAMLASGDREVKADAVIVELGAGALRKTSLILSAFARLVPSGVPSPPITYYALDLEERELVRTLEALNASDVGAQLCGRLATCGLCATYDDGFKFIREGGLDDRTGRGFISATPLGQQTLKQDELSISPPADISCAKGGKTDGTPPFVSVGHSPLHILFLGSSLGNFARGEDAAFLRSLPLRPGSTDTLLLGLDHDNSTEDIMTAYHDPQCVVEAFIRNGMRCAGRALGDEDLFMEDKWAYAGRYDEEKRNHAKYYKSLEDQTLVDPVSGVAYLFKTGELVHIMDSHKYSDRDVEELFIEADLQPRRRWTDGSHRYSLWLLERPAFSCPSLESLNRGT